MSRSQWLPGHRKYGAMTTVVAPADTQASTAAPMDGSASSMWAASTLGRPRAVPHSADELLVAPVGLLATGSVVDDHDPERGPLIDHAPSVGRSGRPSKPGRPAGRRSD